MKKTHYFILSILLITPALSMLAGLAVAPLVGMLIVASLADIRKFPTIKYRSISIIIMCFLVWGLISCLWAPNLSSGLALWGKLSLLAMGGAIALTIAAERPKSPYTALIPVYALCLALIIAMEERISNGFLTTLIHQLLGSSDYTYNATELNRGATLVALCIWPALLVLVNKNRKPTALLLLVLTFAVLLMLKSLSAVMGIIAGTICFILILRFKNNGIKILATALLAAVLLIPFLMIFQNPSSIMQRFPHIPASSEHRLYIWHFTAQKALLNPVRGWGLNASRHIPIHPEDILPGNKSPLPIHPHNSIMQLWLELGIPGILLFAGFILTLLQHVRNITDTTYKAACASGIVAYFTIGLTAFGIWQEWWVASGLLLALWLITAHKNIPANEPTAMS